MGRKAQFPPKIHEKGGYARVYLNGVWHHLGVAGSKEADDKYRALIAGPPTSVRTVVNPPLLQLCDLYLSDQAKRRGGRRELDNIKSALLPLTRCFGKTPARQFRAHHLEELQEKMAAGSWLTAREKEDRLRHRQPIGWCRNVVNQHVRRVRQLFKWAERKELVLPGTHGNLQTVPALSAESGIARDTEPRQASRLEDVEKVATHCAPPVGAMLLLQWWTGMRTGEVLILRTMDLDRSGEVWRYKPGSDLPFGRHKNTHRRQQRIVPIGPEARRILLPWLRPDSPADYIFQPQANRACRTEYTRHTYARHVARASRRAGVKVTGYEGRHAFKKRVTREMGLEAAAAALGQKSLRTTENYSGEIDVEFAAEVAKKMG